MSAVRKIMSRRSRGCVCGHGDSEIQTVEEEGSLKQEASKE